MDKKILLIGDSITEAFKTSELLPEYNIINKGIYGDNTTGVLKRIERDVIEENPDQVFILIGTNDFALERSDDELTSNICEIIELITENLDDVIVYLTPILPTKNIENRPNDRIRGVNEILKMLTEKYGIEYFDLYSQFVNSAGELDALYTIDGLHLSAEAYKKWAAYLKEELDRLPN